MCARFAQTLSARAYAERYGALLPQAPQASGARVNTRPTDWALVLRRHPETGTLHLDQLRWGLVPVWAQDATRAARLINARSETVAETAAFKGAWTKARRCVVPVDGYYEWGRPVGDDTMGKAGSGKQPFRFFARQGGPLALAGLWEGWKDPANGTWLRTFTLLTCGPNTLTAPLHDRMPVILRQDDIPTYLGDPDPRHLLAPFPAGEMAHEPVSFGRPPPSATLFG